MGIKHQKRDAPSNPVIDSLLILGANLICVVRSPSWLLSQAGDQLLQPHVAAEVTN